MTYAITRKRTPSTGEVLLDGVRWARATAPMAEIVAMTLRTQLGACAVDLELGVDWRSIAKLSTGAPATARTAIETALGRYVRAGQITDLSVSTRVDANRLWYEVSYRDPRLTTANPIRITGAV